MLALQVCKSTVLRYNNATTIVRTCSKNGASQALQKAAVNRHFMSSMTVASPQEENHFALILGKPGGGKGTISGKILKVLGTNRFDFLLRWKESYLSLTTFSICISVSTFDRTFHNFITFRREICCVVMFVMVPTLE
jgi:hypothetical protein